MINKKSLKAFSLIELSIVILVIGILVAGVMGGVNLLKKIQIQTAQILTKSSPVSGIKNLVVWHETSLESSFISTETTDGNKISTWYDNNPQVMIKNNATQSNPGVRPKFYNDVFNGLPSVRFDGTNYIVLSMRGLENSNFTIFIVEKRGGDNSTYDEFLAGSAAGNPRLGYRNGSTAIFYLVNDLDYSSQYFVNHVPLIHTYWLSGTAGKKYWLNGGKNPVTANSSQTTLAPSFVNYSAGAYGGNKYEGDIAEIIAFSRTLNDVERRSVESYLGQKYKITLSK